MIDQSLESLAKDIAETQKKMEEFKIQRDIEYIYFLGITGSGKSTSINYMLHGNTLKFEKKKGSFFITPPPGTKSPVIGNTNASCTVIPELFTSDNKIVYVDPPGFMDTNGPHQETINSYSNARMFKKGVQAKLVIILEYSSLKAARGGNVAEVAERLFKLFPKDFDRLTHSTMIIITKVSLADDQQEDIIDLVKQISQQNKNMSIQSKTMIQAIIQTGNISILPLPTYLTDYHIQKIQNNIKNLRPTMLSQNATISLSFQAQSMMQDLSNMVANEISSYSNAIRGQIEVKYLSTALKTVDQFDHRIQKLKVALNIILSEGHSDFLQTFLNFAEKIQLSPHLSEKVILCMKKMEFCKTLHSQVKPNISLVEYVVNNLREAIGNLEAKMTKLVTKQEMQEINKKHSQQIEKRNKQYNKMIDKLSGQAKRRQEQAKVQINNQKKMFQNMMKQTSQQHAQQMRILRQEMQALANRPIVVQQQSSGWCSIM